MRSALLVAAAILGLLAGCENKPPGGAGAPLPPSTGVTGKGVTGRVVADPLPPRQ